MSFSENQPARWTYVLDEPTRILVVDDDPILREFASVHLATPSAAIDTAADGESALQALRARRYDVVLLDIEMPRLDGFSLLATIRTDDNLRHLPVIMLTGHDDIASIDQAYQAGANSFAAKPVNWRQLSYHIRYVIRASSMETAREARDNGKIGMSTRSVAPAGAREADEFLHAFIRRADALVERLSVSGLAQDGQIVRTVRVFAEQALAAHAALRPSDQPAAAAPDRMPSATKRPPIGLVS